MSIVSSTRKAIPLALVCLALVAGCRQQRQQPAAVSTEPLTIDPAMQMRTWDRTPAHYVNGGVIAGSTRFFYQPQEEVPTLQTMILEPVLFPIQTVLIPVTWIPEPPGTAKLYRGDVYEPHHNLQTPLETIPY